MNQLLELLALRKHFPRHGHRGVVVARVGQFLLTDDPLLGVLVPGLYQVHGPGPAVAAKDGELTSYEAGARHHATASVQSRLGIEQQLVSLYLFSLPRVLQVFLISQSRNSTTSSPVAPPTTRTPRAPLMVATVQPCSTLALEREGRLLQAVPS